MELNQQLINDLQGNDILYYPCCGMDFHEIPIFFKNKKNINIGKNFCFIHIDANNKNAKGWFTQIEFLENKIGLANLKIENHKTYLFDQSFYLEIAEILNEFNNEEKDSIIKFIKGVPDPKAIRFELEFEDNKFILYYFYFEAITIISYINRFGLSDYIKGLLVHAPGGGWTDVLLLEAKLIESANSQYIVYDHQTQIQGYGPPIIFPQSNNKLWLSFNNEYNMDNITFERIVRINSAI